MERGTGDIPPDKYRFTIPNPRDLNQVYGGPSYHDGIGTVVGKMFNFNNVDDAALTAWDKQQITKPDSGGDWNYKEAPVVGRSGWVEDTFGPPARRLFWDQNPNILADRPEILGHIIPSRTHALGAVNVPVESGFGSNLNMTTTTGFMYGTNNYDHSAQFLSNYQTRKEYWDRLIEKFGERVIQ